MHLLYSRTPPINKTSHNRRYQHTTMRNSHRLPLSHILLFNNNTSQVLLRTQTMAHSNRLEGASTPYFHLYVIVIELRTSVSDSQSQALGMQQASPLVILNGHGRQYSSQ
jgi:hypothetical protein